jgi:hypothetical protein
VHPLVTGPWLLAAFAVAASGPVDVARPWDATASGALGMVYDGDFHAAEERLAALAAAHPDDPVLPYLRALAVEWRLEQDPASRAHDADMLSLADRSLAVADARLAQSAVDGRALLARGAAHGVKSRLHLFRWEKTPASREAVRMREALVAARAAGVDALDLDFGLGLYDYYADTLPRFFKVVAFLMRIPGGDRDRGLASIARVARGGSFFHDDEARVQMYDIHSYFEGRPDRSIHWIREMWRLHRDWPLWGLKLAQLLGEPMGLWGESAAVARDILATAEEGRRPNYQPVVGAMARVLLAEALLGDLRIEDACAATQDRGAELPLDWRGRAERVRARCVELARDTGSPAGKALVLLAQARRLRESGDTAGADATCLRAFQAFPASPEARLCAAEHTLQAGRPAAARALAGSALEAEGPPELRPFARLLVARARESEGDTAEALRQYRAAWDEPLGRPAVRAEAAAAIVRLQPGAALAEAPPLER